MVDAQTSTTVTCTGCGTRNRVPAVASGPPRCAKCKKSLTWITEADDTTFDAVTGTSVPVLVDFWAPWCGPCKIVSPVVEAVGADNAGQLKVVKVNVDQAPGLATQYGVQGIPTLVLLRSGRVLGRQVGALSHPALSAWLRSQVAANPA